jgi:competence ComEA-like helix-hairpin-helix protein
MTLVMAPAVAAAAPPAPIQTAEPSFDQLVKQGQKKFEAKDYDGALELFEEAYAIKPTANLLYNIARMYESLGQFQDAIDHYKKFLVAPDIDIQIRQEALERIKTLDEVIKLTGGGDTSGGSGTPTPTTKPPAAGGLININTADAKALETLPGIGPSKASAIIAYREANGPFPSVDTLSNVKGIGPKTIEKFRDRITVGP